jgi:hypothetical protein
MQEPLDGLLQKVSGLSGFVTLTKEPGDDRMVVGIHGVHTSK